VVWVDPPRLDGPGEVTVRLRVGDHLAFELERGFEADRVTRFEHHRAAGVRDLRPGRDPSTPPPYARVGLGAPGGHLLVLDRPATEITLAPAKFDHYLAHEGLVGALRERRRRGETDDPGRERYSRHLKAFVQVGDTRDQVGFRPTGQALEIVPHTDPAVAAVGTRFAVELREDDRPLAGHPLDALVRVDGETRTTRVTTTAEGRAAFHLDEPGRWVLRTVSMSRCRRDCDEIDWESRWTSFSFHVPAAPAR